MTPVFLLAALCGVILDLNPAGPQYDFIKYVAPDSMQGKHLEGDNTPAYVTKTTDRIWIVKAPEGAPWDENFFDSQGIWAWRTENDWSDPRSYSTWLNVHQVLMAPRVVRGGYPGMRWFSCDSRYSPTTQCGTVGPIHDLGGGIVNELWGPYTGSVGWGNLGTFQYLTLVYGYGCTSPDPATPATESCSSIETTHWTAEYGGVWWALYGRDGAGAWKMLNHTQQGWVRPGNVAPFFPCDTIVP